VEVYRFGQCLDWTFSTISTFFSLVSSRVFRDAPHSLFRCRDPSQCLPNFLKMLTLAVPKNLRTCILLVEGYGLGQCLGWTFLPISTFFSLVSSHVFRDASHSHFRCRDPNLCLRNLLKKLLLLLPQIYTRVFHSWKSIDLDSAWVRDSRHYELSFLS